MAMIRMDGGEPDDEAMVRFQKLFGPTQVDQMIRQAISMCWMGLPVQKKAIDEVEKQISRMVQRALDDLREDATAFGIDDES